MSQIKVGAWYTSSVNPEKIGITITGGLMAISTIVVYTLNHFVHFPITVQEYADVVTQFSAIISGVLFVYGLIQKFFVKVMSIFHR